MSPRAAASGLTVAVTGPTGEIGRAVVDALQRARGVARVVGMARRPFDPAARGWTKVSYRRGDVLDREAVFELVAEADVVVHLAFVIIGGARESAAVNMRGSRNVFEAAASAGVARLVYASSVAAYGFGGASREPITEQTPLRGDARLYYSVQKAEVEALLDRTLNDSATEAYVFRPCVVAGRNAPLLVDSLTMAAMTERIPRAARRLLTSVPLLRPVLPDPGVRFQLVHHDDVASAMRAAVLGRGAAGAYNLAGPGLLTVAQLARELGWYSLPVPRLALDAAAEAAGLVPLVPPRAQWLAALRDPPIVDATKARRTLRWRPRHDALATLRETVAAARSGARAP
jgi:UDP-glucose 4-epimerase